MSADLLAEFGLTSSPSPSTKHLSSASSATPKRNNTDFSSAVNLVAPNQSPATRFSQQPWLQANTQTNISPFGPSPRSQQAPSPGKVSTHSGLQSPPAVFGLGLGGIGGQQGGVHDSPAIMEDEDDLWGEFETSQEAAPAPAPAPPQNRIVHLARYTDEPVKNRVVRASTLDLMTNNFSFVPSPPSAAAGGTPQRRSNLSISSTPPVPEASEAKAPKVHKTKQSLSNVLFDAGDYAAYEMDDDDNDDDEFGEFETVTPTPPLASSPYPPPPSNQQQKPQQKPPTLQPNAHKSPTSVDLVSLLDLDSPPITTTSVSSSILAPSPAPASLFSPRSAHSRLSAAQSPQTLPSPDFGDWTKLSFGATRAASVAGSQPLNSPSGSVVSNRLHVITPERSPVRNPVPGASAPAVAPNTPTPVTAWPSGLNSASTPQKQWAPFVDSPDDRREPFSPPASEPTTKSKLATSSDWDWDDSEPSALDNDINKTNPNVDDASPSEPPPTNVPPPSVILATLPEILIQASSCLFGPMAKHAHNPALRERVMADPKTLGFLSAHLAVATVAARVLAGRKLRWHRDKFLAQGMAISAAGATGMKLASVDRSQAVREDREAADFVAVWRKDVGRLRSAVAAANAAASASAPLRVPEIADAMVVQTARMVPTAPRPCVVCGLRRDERVARVDVDVEDSFGEWWIEHWGHRTCRNFWKQNEGRMRGR